MYDYHSMASFSLMGISHKIKNLIFDLGGVIMDLDFSKTHLAFSNLSGLSIEALRGKIHTTPFFNEYEKGLITDNEFRDHMRLFLDLPDIGNQEIDAAWNALLLDITEARYKLLRSLKSRYNTFLLSNNNSIHLSAVNEIVFKTSGEKSLAPFFHKIYFSHLMKMRKPDPKIFSTVLNENNLKPDETLFLDDILENIEGAKSVGLHTIQITSTNQILSLFS